MPEIFDGLGVLLISIGVAVFLIRLGNGLAAGGRPRPRGVTPPSGAEASELEAQLEATARRALTVIRVHPEGIRLTELGEELGADWRTLIGPVNRLIERGLVRKEDRRYYPR